VLTPDNAYGVSMIVAVILLTLYIIKVVRVVLELLLVLQIRGQPVKTFVQSVTTGGTCRLDVPVTLAEGVETELVGDLSSIHGVWQILLVCENKEEGITKFIFVQHAMELIACLRDTLPIITIHNKDNTLCVLEVMAPQRTNLQRGEGQSG